MNEISASSSISIFSTNIDYFENGCSYAQNLSVIENINIVCSSFSFLV